MKTIYYLDTDRGTYFTTLQKDLLEFCMMFNLPYEWAKEKPFNGLDIPLTVTTEL